MKTEEQEVIKANAAFYTAFSDKDVVTMSDVWSTEQNITVIHPGWPAVQGREPVISSWTRIMTGGNSPGISCINAHANILGNVAMVICTEVLDEIELVATNTFIKEAGQWKMVHHQASPLPQSNDIQESDILH